MKTNLLLPNALLLLTLISCNSSGSGTTAGGVTGPKLIFITAATFDGDLGGVSGADNLCMTDTNYPGTGTYKALLAASSRSASPTPTDWVLYANMEYRREVDDVVIGTTTADRVFTFPLDAAFSTSNIFAFTGMLGDWTNGPNNCDSWTDNTGGFPRQAQLNQTTSASIGNNATTDCTLSATDRLICVEQ